MTWNDSIPWDTLSLNETFNFKQCAKMILGEMIYKIYYMLHKWGVLGILKHPSSRKCKYRIIYVFNIKEGKTCDVLSKKTTKRLYANLSQIKILGHWFLLIKLSWIPIQQILYIILCWLEKLYPGSLINRHRIATSTSLIEFIDCFKPIMESGF